MFRKILFPTLALNLFLFFMVYAINRSSAQFEKNYREGEFLIQLGKNKNIYDFKKDFPAYEVLDVVSESWKIYLIRCDELKNKEPKVLQELTKSTSINKIQRNHKVELRRSLPDDPSFSDMWGLDNSGQNGGKDDADIDAPEAWEITTGGLTSTGDTIVVAVIDDGFQLSHPDIDFWTNHGEIGDNSIDDDGNGYIDDMNGWNVFNNNGVITSSRHGTHVSGTIGAKGNNGFGVTGVNWNVKVMAIQGLSGNEATVIRAYSYVFDQRKLYNQTNGQEGAFIVSTNASFGVNYGKPSDFPLWCAIYDSLGTVGILNAGATANLGINVDNSGDIPTACASPFLVSVTNTNKYDEKYSSSGFGLTTIDLGSPGTAILSTVPTNSYSSLTGTSMASPHVAGAIALMWAAACPELMQDYKDNPDSIALVMKNIMLDNVDPVPALEGITVSGGRLNVHKALQGVLDLCNFAPVPSVQGDTACIETPAILTASPGVPDNVVYWYDDRFGNQIYIGDTLEVPSLSYSRTYYAANYDVNTGIKSIKIPVEAVAVNPIKSISPDTTINLINGGAAQLWVNGGETYSWMPIDGLTDPNISNPKASPLITTIYTVTVTDTTGCQFSDSVKVTVIDNTGVPETNQLSEVKIYPNPFKETVVFDFTDSFSEKHKVSIAIFDIMGKKLFDSGIIKGNTYAFERKNLPAGLYIYRIELGSLKNEIYDKLIIID